VATPISCVRPSTGRLAIDHDPLSQTANVIHRREGTLRTVRKAGLTGLGNRHTSRLMTGRVGYVRATSVNPAAENIAAVPVKTADPPTREAVSAATSTG